MNRRRVRVAITGAQVSPEEVSVRELVRVLSRLDRAISSYAKDKRLEVPPGAAPSLVEITAGSENLVLSVPDPLMPAVAGISKAIESRRYTGLSAETYEELHGLSESVVNNGWGFEVHEDPQYEVRAARITPDEPLPPPAAPVYVTGTTVIHGRCLRVGGAVTPKAEIRLSTSSKLLNVDLSEEVAKELAKQLYEEVAIEGSATWNADTWELVDFRVSQITAFRKTDPESAFRELAEAAGGHWDGVDPLEYVRGVREEG